MKEVYMDADLGQLKSILETAQEINKAERNFTDWNLDIKASLLIKKRQLKLF